MHTYIHICIYVQIVINCSLLSISECHLSYEFSPTKHHPSCTSLTIALFFCVVWSLLMMFLLHCIESEILFFWKKEMVSMDFCEKEKWKRKKGESTQQDCEQLFWTGRTDKTGHVECCRLSFCRTTVLVIIYVHEF